MTTDPETPPGDDSALRDALEREAATREILQVISLTRDDEGPVLKIINETAMRLCRATEAAIWRIAGDRFELGALRTTDPALEPSFAENPIPLDRRSAGGRAVADRKPVQVEDLQADTTTKDLPITRIVGSRTVLAVPLLAAGGDPIGAITIFRREVRLFEPQHIELVETFAAQAVIAIENVRQFRELQTRLAREAATREVLEVISQSRDDETPVFDSILRSVARLCGTSYADLDLVDAAGTSLEYAAHVGETLTSFTLGKERTPLDGPHQVARTVREARTLHTPDLADTELYRSGDPVRRRWVDVEGARCFLSIPLVAASRRVIGCMSLCRHEPKPFTPDEIALAETFAAQAVIAIENVRQFRELRTRLEREAATREVLQVISQSRDDERPVFEAILQRAAHLCGSHAADLKLSQDDGRTVQIVAHCGAAFTSFPIGLVYEPSPDLLVARSIRERKVIHVSDIRDDEVYRRRDPVRVRMVEVEGIRTYMAVPLIRGERAIGSLSLYRLEVRAFSDDEIALLETFAAQAVIAIENVRQFRELGIRLEREAATREILQVIAESRADEKPVFDAILENASRLCDAPLAFLSMANDERTHVTVPAHRGARSGFAAVLDEFRLPIAGSKLVAIRPITECQVIRIDDIAETEMYRERDPYRVAMVEDEGIRSLLAVPLIGGGEGIGAIVLYRREVAPFSDDDVALAESFAAQAVIAVENVKQFKALQARTEEVQALNASLEGRVATQVDELERLGRLKRFLSPQVAEAVVSSGDDKLLSSHRALIATLFCDMRGFTAFCETAEPEETIEVLRTYHEEMGALIVAHGAGVDHRSGDGIMVIFNDPFPCDSPTEDAVRLALAMRARMSGLCAQWRKLGHRLGFGVGISLGYATVGVVGSAGRYDYTASGTAVNLAARLCEQAGDGEILLSPRAHQAVESVVVAEPAGALVLKGIQAPVEVMRIVRMKDSKTPAGTA